MRPLPPTIHMVFWFCILLDVVVGLVTWHYGSDSFWLPVVVGAWILGMEIQRIIDGKSVAHANRIAAIGEDLAAYIEMTKKQGKS